MFLKEFICILRPSSGAKSFSVLQLLFFLLWLTWSQKCTWSCTVFSQLHMALQCWIDFCAKVHLVRSFHLCLPVCLQSIWSHEVQVTVLATVMSSRHMVLMMKGHILHDSQGFGQAVGIPGSAWSLDRFLNGIAHKNSCQDCFHIVPCSVFSVEMFQMFIQETSAVAGDPDGLGTKYNMPWVVDTNSLWTASWAKYSSGLSCD